MSMKKFFVPLFLLLILGCSNEEIKPSDKAASEQKKRNFCYIEKDDEYIKNISESLCNEIGGEGLDFKKTEDVSSSSDEELSSSSRGNISRSSSSGGGAGNSSSVVAGSSSSGDAGSSSSGGAGSSSSGGAGSSSSGGAGSSSSVIAGSSSSVVAGSSSSVVAGSSSSSSISSSSSAPPSLGACSAFPYYYVAKTKREYIKDLVPSNGCGNITYTVPSGNGSSYASIIGDSISFENATASATERTITIRATASVSQCNTPPKECPITVIIADGYKDARCNHRDIFNVNLNDIKTATTVIEYACCESKNNYFLTCANSVNYTLKVKGGTPISSTGGNANFPELTPIPESSSQCPTLEDYPGGTLYRYPERILMTVSNTSTIPDGGFSCNSW